MSDETTSTAPIEAPSEAIPPAAPAEATPKPPPKADEWVKFNAQEKRLRKQAEELEARRKDVDAKAKALEELEALKAKAKTGDPEAIGRLVDEFGVDYDAFTRYQLRGRKVDPSEKTARELAERVAKIERERAEAAERASAEAWEATANGFRTHVLKESPADYPLLAGEIEAEPDYIDSVLRSIEKHARESGQPTTIRDAALKLERYFREQTERRAARLKPAAAQPASVPSGTPSPENSNPQARPRDQQTGRFAGGDGPRRLTNDLSAERSAAPKGKEPGGRKLTQRERDIEERERIRRAANAMTPR